MTIKDKLKYPASVDQEAQRKLYDQFPGLLDDLKAKVVDSPPKIEWGDLGGSDVGRAVYATWTKPFQYLDDLGVTRDLTVTYTESTEYFGTDIDESRIPASDDDWFSRSYELLEGDEILLGGYIHYGEAGEETEAAIDDSLNFPFKASEERSSINALREAIDLIQ